MMKFTFVIGLSMLSAASALVPLRFGILPTRPSRIVLSLIDADAVAASVSIDQIPKNQMNPATAMPPAPIAPAPIPSLGSVTSPEDTTRSDSPSATVRASPPPAAVSRPLPANEQLNLPVPVIAGGLLALFAAGTFAMRQRGDEEDSVSLTSSAATGTSAKSVDVSIPYDAAARMAYDEWRAAHNKGGFDVAKYANFKTNYEQVTSANMAAKKRARDKKSKPKLETLSASADMKVSST